MMRMCACWSVAVLGVAVGVLLAGPPVVLAQQSDSKVKADVKAEKPTADGTQVVTVKLDIDKGWHLHANPVDNVQLETNATKLTFLGGDQALDAKVDYPKGKKATLFGETLNIYEGTVTIKATVQRPKEGSVKLQIRVAACDHEKCLQPGKVFIDLP